jgi:FkbM family methyltransferase
MKTFNLVDIGCAGALHHYWNNIPINNINIIGVDANVAEIGKLRLEYPNYTWIAAQVGKAKSIDELNSKTAYNIFNRKVFTEKLISLDDVCENPDFIKIDVDGYDLEVLESGPKALTHASGIYLESEFEIPAFNPRNNLFNHGELLRSYGFHLEYMWGQRYSIKYSNPYDKSCRARCVGNGLWLKDSHKLKNFWKKIYCIPKTWLGEE